MRARFAEAILIAAMLAGCAQVPPAPLYSPLATTRTFGYSEQPLSQTAVRVMYVTLAVRVNSSSQIEAVRTERMALAYDLALWRAAELTLASGNPAFTVTDRQNDVDVHDYTYYGDPWDPWGSPYYYRGCFARPGYWPPDRWIDVGALVNFVAHFESANTPNNYNAQFVIDQARTKYGSVMVSSYYESAPSTTVSAGFSAAK